MIVIYDEIESCYMMVTNNGKTEIRVDENAFTIVLNEDGETYTATPVIGYVSIKQQKTEVMQSLMIAREFANTTEGDADILALKQQYSDLCNGVPIVTKAQIEIEKAEVETQLLDANLDRDYYFGIILEDEGMWG